ncbi:hypothetical protein H6P81_011250 [Aristolochia fimbriata]|uniref:Activating signal cointegrator 1 n=1 Tax=Aristolochia fimbriata TaxID=158543 RepID=A0AAV7ET66_ARIFI|nr:hypothetical protein H6P81_011250 [Aristolochia fimbriata]
MATKRDTTTPKFDKAESSKFEEERNRRDERSSEMKSGGSGEWLERALLDLYEKVETELALDPEVISGLVSYCEMAPLEDAEEYLNNIIGQEAGHIIINEYLQRRGYAGATSDGKNSEVSKFQAYMKPPADTGSTSATRKQTKLPKQEAVSNAGMKKNQSETTDVKKAEKGNSGISKKKKSSKVVSLAEAAKGSIVFQQGKPCSCQARRHKLVSNCLSCGKIICEQEGEGPCSFCGALVLREGSTYAGLEDTLVPQSDAEVVAEAFTKRLVDYDRNSAARTTVIDDQSDYYELDGNSWLSPEEKELLKQKNAELEEAERARRKKVVMTFDLVGRKVLMDSDGQNPESEYRILRPADEREVNRIKPNPTVAIQPAFVDPGQPRNPARGKENTKTPTGLCLEVSGRVQHDGTEGEQKIAAGKHGPDANNNLWKSPAVGGDSHMTGDEPECSFDYR